MRTFAYLGSSKEGGTYRVFETLRDGLAEQGWVGQFVNESCLPAPMLDGPEKEILRALREYLSEFDMVIGNVFISVRLMNVLRFLPATTPRLMIVHSITYATYLAALSLRDYVQHTVAVSPRIRSDLLRRGFAPQVISSTFNAVPNALFQPPAPMPADGILRLLSLGRIEERSKGLFLLPEILRSLDPSRYQLTVAGDGPDRAELLRRLHAAGIVFDAPGQIARADLAKLYQEHQVFLFPSRFEGQGVAAAEAMANGLVPVAAHIPGVTDAYIEDGHSGLLFGQGDAAAARTHLQRLICDPALTQSMREAAYATAQRLFSVRQMLDHYENAMRLAGQADPIPPRSLTRWRAPLSMGRGLRSLIPTGLRQRLARKILYK